MAWFSVMTLVGIEAETGEAEQDGTPFGEIHEQPAETCALGSGVHGHVPDVQGVPGLGQLDQAQGRGRRGFTAR